MNDENQDTNEFEPVQEEEGHTRWEWYMFWFTCYVPIHLFIVQPLLVH